MTSDAYDVPLTKFKWDAKKRRLDAKLTDVLGTMARAKFTIKGEKEVIEFVYWTHDKDPESTEGRFAWIYRPDRENTPSEYRDIVLYLHSSR